MLQSRQGADLTSAFPDVAAAAADLGEAIVLDGGLVVPHEGRLRFGQLRRRACRQGRSAIRAAAEPPAYLIVFDVPADEAEIAVVVPVEEATRPVPAVAQPPRPRSACGAQEPTADLGRGGA